MTLVTRDIRQPMLRCGPVAQDPHRILYWLRYVLEAPLNRSPRSKVQQSMADRRRAPAVRVRFRTSYGPKTDG